MRHNVALVLLALAPSLSLADQVILKTGGRLSGVIIQQTEQTVTIETGPGPVTLPMSRVEKILMGKAFLAEFRERAAQLARNDVEGWLALAEWCGARGLATQAREAYERVLALDPQNAAARRGTGDIQVNGRWMTPEEGNLARGLVQFEGRWMSAAERDALIAERRDETLARAERARAEAEARTREAEARAREAESRARAAEAQSDASQAVWIDPTRALGPVYPCQTPGGCGGGTPPPVTCGPGMSGPACPAATPDPAPQTTPRSRERPATSKRGSSAKGAFAAVPAK
jgi:tetratricopeptide (TPR) repeat protein